MADELNTPTHRWYQRRYNIALSPNEVSPKWILAAGIAKIDAWIASISGGSAYAVNGFDPALVFDFVGNYFRKSSEDSTLAAATTYTGASNGTMTDSDGLIKWKPHNLLRYSEDFSQWSKGSNTTLTAGFTGPDGGSNAYRVEMGQTSGTFLKLASTLVTGSEYTLSIYVKDNGTGSKFTLDIGFGGNPLISVTDEWVQYSITFTAPSITVYANIDNGSHSSGTDILIYGAHVYRSDLGGMVDNPAQPAGLETYVPTTSAAVYLPRTGNHVYNGAAWVNEGLLLESEARTNLLTNSSDFTAWATVASTLTNTGAAAPDGSASWRLTDNGTTFFHGAHLQNAFTVGAGFTTWSVMCREGTARYVAFAPKSAPTVSTVNVSVIFDLQTGVFTDTGNGPNATYIDGYGSENLGGGWYRIYFKSDLASANYDGIGVFISTDGLYANLSYTGTGEYIDFALAQIEVGSTPSSYIPNAGATAGVTRAAETLTVAAADMPAYTTAVSIQMDGTMTYADTGGFYHQYLWQLDGYNRVRGYVNTQVGYVGRQTIAQEVGNIGDTVALTGAYSPGINVPFNIASRHGSTFINGAVDGTALTANLTPTALPDLSAADFGFGSNFMGNIGKLRVWADDLTDTGIVEATLPSTEPSLSLTFDGSETSFTVLDWSE